MAFTDLYTNLDLLLRWLHVIAGIVWIGHLYFFNFVNVPLQNVLDDAARRSVNPHLMPRALWWFRWGAMTTFVAGLLLFAMRYMYTPGQGWGLNENFLTPDGRISGRAVWILFGMLLATVMWFNVWFVIWPAQKKILSGRAPAEQLPALRRRAFIFSRTNVYLSGPMLFGMLAPHHYPAVNILTLVVAIVIGAVAVALAIWASFRAGRAIA